MEYRARYSADAQTLRTEPQYFNCTPDEFIALLKARAEAPSEMTTGDFVNRGPATEQARRLFGEERAKEFERVTDTFYQQAREVVDRLGLPLEHADRAWTISRGTHKKADEIVRNTALSIDERKRRREIAESVGVSGTDFDRFMERMKELQPEMDAQVAAWEQTLPSPREERDARIEESLRHELEKHAVEIVGEKGRDLVKKLGHFGR